MNIMSASHGSRVRLRPKREALHLLSVSRGELNPILLFMRKPEEQKLLGDGNAK